ncbi:MAG: aldehyde dehydrogenase family protein [Planctomycetes bacterium]|nr:aldehyde dehydrogenase family protein [Planctomycetota bacterium]
MAKYLNYINGKWISASTGRFFNDINPATQEIVGEFPSSGPDDVDEAASAAKKAFASWRKMPAPKRGEILYKAGKLLIERKEELAKTITLEMGKVLTEARGDVQEAIDTAFYCAGEGRRLFGITTPSELANKSAMTVRAPIGVCAVITPWNFPVAIPSWKIFPAILSGNTVVFKSASDTPLCAAEFVKILEESGVPAGVVNLVHGSGSETGNPLIEHKDVNLISFTGSTEVGRNIAASCGKSLKRVSLELGGKNAQIVMDDADMPLAVKAAVWGAFATSGQRCTATSRLILHKDIKKGFLRKFFESVFGLKIGTGLEKGVDMGPLVNEARRKSVAGYVQAGLDEGAELLCGGKSYTKGNCKNGFFFEPTVFDGVTPEMRIAREEIFGPVVSILTVNSLDEAIATANNTSYGLSSSIFTTNINKAFSAIENIDCGIIYVNSSTIGAENHLPFGGYKNSGNGHREAGTAVFDIYTEIKTVYIDYSGALQRAQIDL